MCKMDRRTLAMNRQLLFFYKLQILLYSRPIFLRPFFSMLGLIALFSPKLSAPHHLSPRRQIKKI
uniref:Uncharacterized protein n=1 Tax=Rhizophora mucronata TaxID=61149 RepID=A0A2P2MZQ5_RHIMU